VGTWALVGTLAAFTLSDGLASSRTAPIGTVLLATSDTGKMGLVNTRVNTQAASQLASQVAGQVDTRYEGTAIYDGDILKTKEGSTLRVQLNGPQMVMRSNSFAEVHAIERGFSADLRHGTINVSTSKGQTFKVVADGVTIRSAGDAATVAQIALVSANEIVLGSEKGSLELSLGTEAKTIEPGNSYRVELEPDQPEARAQGSRPKHPGTNYWNVTIIGATIVVTVIFIWRTLISPSAP
jgi:hypothetical protein